MDRASKISVNPECYILLAASFLLFPIRWIISWITASLFHELCHYAMLRLRGNRVLQIKTGINGTVMETDIYRNSDEILCALSGPAGGLVLILLGRWFPRVAICGLFQSVYNLIPIYPLDGGRIVHGILKKFVSENKRGMIEKWIDNGVLVLIVVLAIYAVFVLKLGFVPFILAGILILKNKQIKFTCKEQVLGVK